MKQDPLFLVNNVVNTGGVLMVVVVPMDMRTVADIIMINMLTMAMIKVGTNLVNPKKTPHNAEFFYCDVKAHTTYIAGISKVVFLCIVISYIPGIFL
jgi:hypothetical protein